MITSDTFCTINQLKMDGVESKKLDYHLERSCHAFRMLIDAYPTTFIFRWCWGLAI